jgi:hypothetical protein
MVSYYRAIHSFHTRRTNAPTARRKTRPPRAPVAGPPAPQRGRRVGALAELPRGCSCLEQQADDTAADGRPKNGAGGPPRLDAAVTL